MKKEWTEEDLRRFASDAELVFDGVGLRELSSEEAEFWKGEGLEVNYELRNGQVSCVLRRQINAGSKRWELCMAAPLAGNTLPEDRLTEREREMCREDMNHDFLTGVFNRRYLETVFCTNLDTWTDEHRNAAIALVAVDSYEAMLRQNGQPIMDQVVCYVANQWKKHYDHPAERVVCRLNDSMLMIGCADYTETQLESELAAIYDAMPHECISSVGLMRRVPFSTTIACASTDEVRGKNWNALYSLCDDRLRKAQDTGGGCVYRV